MSAIAIGSMNTRQITQQLPKIIQAGLVPFIKSSPGMGKSSIVKQIAKLFNLKLIDLRLSAAVPEDFNGLPFFEGTTAKYVPFDTFPITSTPLPEGKDGWMIFLDEFNSGSRNVLAAVYKLILDREIGQEKLHPNAVIVCAGNLMTDRAITNNIGTALESRVIHLNMHCDPNIWIEDVATKYEYDHRVIGFISAYPEHLMDFKPDHTGDTFCCPRTWEFASKYIKGSDVTDLDGNVLCGTLTEGVAIKFAQFTRIYQNLININDVVKDLVNAPITRDHEARWAVVTHLAATVGEASLDPVWTYIQRMDVTEQVVFMKMVMARKMENGRPFQSHPSAFKLISTLGAYLA